MQVFSHFAVDTLSNTYLIGIGSGKAMLVDPGAFDADLLELIEHQSYTIAGVLLTHADTDHLSGLRTLCRVYSDMNIRTAMPEVIGYGATAVHGGETLNLSGAAAEVISLPGQGRDCVAYLINGFLFCGTALSAGELGRVSNPYAKAILMASIAESVLTLPKETVILPFYGPPTTVEAESHSLPMEDPLELAGLTENGPATEQ